MPVSTFPWWAITPYTWVSLLSLHLRWPIRLPILVKCHVGLPLGENGEIHSLLSVWWNIRCAATNDRQTSKSEITGLSLVIYGVVCGLKLAAKLVLHAITQLNPMVAEIWTVSLGNGCYIINGDVWKLCTLELCRRPVFQTRSVIFTPHQWLRARVPYFGGCRHSCFVGRNKPGVVQTEFLQSWIWTGQAGRWGAFWEGKNRVRLRSSDFIRP